jgi:hypothetical protein
LKTPFGLRVAARFHAMPTVHRSDPYRFFFYAGDRDEPPHTHVERDANIAKFWVDPVRLQNSGGFSRTEINRIQKLVEENRIALLERRNEFFSG